MAEQNIEISDESDKDAEAEHTHTLHREAVDEGAQTTKVRTSKTQPPKDRRSEKQMATPKASTVSHTSTSVTRPKMKEPQGSHSKDTEAGKPSGTTPTPRRGEEQVQTLVDTEPSRLK